MKIRLAIMAVVMLSTAMLLLGGSQVACTPASASDLICLTPEELEQRIQARLAAPTPTPTPLPSTTDIPTPTITNVVPGDLSFTVHWTIPETRTKITGWQIAYRADGEERWRWFWVTPYEWGQEGLRQSATQLFLENGRRYAVFVRAVSDGEYGRWSKGAWVTPQIVTPTPVPTVVVLAPVLTRVIVSAGSIQVDWEQVPSATGYDVRFRVAGGTWYGKRTGAGTSGVSLPGNYATGERYEVQVRALVGESASGWSGEARIVPTPVPTATPTPRPSPTPVPTPHSNAYGMGCVGHPKLPAYFRYHGTTHSYRAVSDVKLAARFTNPPYAPREPWEEPSLSFSYGFIVREVDGRGMVVLIDEQGDWLVTMRRSEWQGNFLERLSARDGMEFENGQVMATHHHGRGLVKSVVSSGNLSENGIPFNVGPEESNHVMFIAKGNTYRLAVNGRDVPLGIDQADLEAIEAVIGERRHYDSGEWVGYYNATYSRYGRDAFEYTGSEHEWAACMP